MNCRSGNTLRSVVIILFLSFNNDIGAFVNSLLNLFRHSVYLNKGNEVKHGINYQGCADKSNNRVGQGG